MAKSKQIQASEEAIFQAEIDAKIAELEVKYGTKISCHYLTTTEGKRVVGYIKQPDRMVKMRVLDQCSISMTTGMDTLLRACLVEESDPVILDENGDDDIYFSYILFCKELIPYYVGASKKK